LTILLFPDVSPHPSLRPSLPCASRPRCLSKNQWAKLALLVKEPKLRLLSAPFRALTPINR
jgi:hypothetical protein